ncbi:hypothetical protein NECAME_08931 [Necator americanus]|uniref:CNH domain-containing protein n=1 Tax=Necator americanus TaxID=51031 RepID=W2TIG1_NECAM|nr:hypothetical protein NECAME_08931 [Necator americanus]ETN80797.1 hypothetical protein NECAME_08931 [Necator americanus]
MLSNLLYEQTSLEATIIYMHLRTTNKMQTDICVRLAPRRFMCSSTMRRETCSLGTRQVIETSEPAMCLTSTSRGFYFGADSFYFVHLGRGDLEPLRLAGSNIADYPIALLNIREDEVLLAYQNYGLFVNSRGERTRKQTVEWEQMPMEFVYTAPYLYVVHYDSIEIMQVAEYNGPDSNTILDEREVYECRNAHVVCCRPNGDVFISISNTDSVEVHRFNATNSKRSAVKRKGLSAATFDKRSKVAL